MIDLFEELRKVTAALDEAKISHALVGGLACSVWLEPRATVDIDLLVKSEEWERIPAVLEPLGYLALAHPKDFQSIRIRRLTKLVDGDAVMLDFLFADGDLIRGIDECARLEVEGEVHRVARPEILIQLKRGRMSDQDKIDIDGLTRLIEEQDS